MMTYSNSDLSSKISTYLPKSMINPLLFNNLNLIYSIRSNTLLGDKSIANIQNIESMNNYTDGRGIKLLQALDESYGINAHKAFPKKQYEFLNSSFVDAIHITSVLEGKMLINDIKEIIKTFEKKEENLSEEISKIGRSSGPSIDMQAKKMFGNWRNYLEPYICKIDKQLEKLCVIPLASDFNFKVSGIDSNGLRELHESEIVILSEVNKKFGIEFKSSSNRLNSFAQLSSLVDFSGVLGSLASVLMKIANDVRFLSSGPRSGYGELTIPENEPGSSIMPGKVNPTQCESLSMVTAQVIGNHTSVTIANGSALFESNSFKPLIANNVLRSIKLLSDGIRSFNSNCAVGIELIENKKKGNF